MPRVSRLRRVAGVAVLVYSLLILSVGGRQAVTFLMGAFYGVVLISGWRSAAPVAGASPAIGVYGLLMFGSGMVTEILAFTAELDNIRAGRDAYLFSRRLVPDLLIGMPQYVAIAVVWSWFFRRYHLTPGRQALVLFLFWALTMDNFSHVPALLSGNVVNFVNAGLLMVSTLNWPLVVLANRLEATMPARRRGKAAVATAFVIQVIPLLVSVAVYLALTGMERWYTGSR